MTQIVTNVQAGLICVSLAHHFSETIIGPTSLNVFFSFVGTKAAHCVLNFDTAARNCIKESLLKRYNRAAHYGLMGFQDRSTRSEQTFLSVIALANVIFPGTELATSHDTQSAVVINCHTTPARFYLPNIYRPR